MIGIIVVCLLWWSCLFLLLFMDDDYDQFLVEGGLLSESGVEMVGRIILACFFYLNTKSMIAI